MPSGDPRWWGAQPPCVAPLYRPPPPVDFDQHGQFLDDDAEDDDEEGGACSLQTVVAAGRPPVPRLDLDSMLASPQPLSCTGTLWGQEPTQGDDETWLSASGEPVGRGNCPASAVDGSEVAGWHRTAGSRDCAPAAADISSAAAELPTRLSRLGVGGADGESRPSPPSLEASPRSVLDTASVSLRSYLDCADVTADVTECETLDPLPALADTSRAGTDADGTSTARTEAAEQPPEDVIPETRAVAGLVGVTDVEPATPMSEISIQGRTAPMASPLSTGRKASTITSLVDSGRGETVTSLLDSGRGETMTSLEDGGRQQSVTSLMKFDFPETTTSLPENEHWSNEGASLNTGRREGVLSNGDAESNNGAVPGAISDARDGLADNIADIIEKIRLETGRALLDSGVDPTSVPALLTSTNGVSSAPPDTAPDETVPAPARQKWSLNPQLSVAEDGLFTDFDGISDLGEPVDPRLTHRRNDASVPTSAAGECAPSTVPEGGRRPAADTAVPKTRPRRSPARRLSFTLESPSPLLVEYYLRHPEERQQVLESAAATVTSPAPHQAAARSPPCPDRLQPPPPPPVSAGNSPSPSSWPERPRRRWRDERPSPAELRAALVRQTSDSSSATVTSPGRELVPAGGDASAPPPPSPAAGGDVPPPREEPEPPRLSSDLPVAWQSVLHPLSEGGAVLSEAPEQEPPTVVVARPSPPRRSAAAAPPPPATLEMSPAAAGAGRRRKRRSGGGPRGTPPRYRQSPRRRPTPNFDSHHIHEIVQGARSVSPSVSVPLVWTPSASPGASPQGPPVPPPQPHQDGPQQPSPGTRTQLTDEELPGLQELRDLLTLHHHQMTSLVEQQRQQRRALEASFRRLEEALLLRLRRQMAVPEALAAVLRAASPDRPVVPGSPPAPLPARPRNGALPSGREVRPPPKPAEPRGPLSAHQRYEARVPRPPPPPQSPAVSPSGRVAMVPAERASVLPPAEVGDAVPTPVARRLASSPPPQQLPVVVRSEALRPEMHARYARVTAAARGYLTRRLMRTEKVQSMVAAAKESMACALRLQREVDLTKRVTRQDVELHERLVNQVRGACYSLHQLFVAGPAWHRLAVIAADRAARLHAAERRRSGDRAHLSRATLAALERKRQREWGDPARSGTASPRGRARPAAGSPRPRSSPQASSRPRRVVAHSPRVPGRTGSNSERTGSSSGRSSRTSRSLLQLANIYAPSGPVRRAKSSQSQLNSSAPPPPSVTVSQPKRRQTAALSRAWR